MRHGVVLLTGARSSDQWRRNPTPLVPLVFIVAAALAATLVACASQSRQSDAFEPTATARIDPTAEELASALRFRTTFGLRADDAWIRSVFRDPASDKGLTFGVPLMTDEIAAVTAAQVAANAVSDIVAAYGAAVPEDWAGMNVDQRTGGTVVARFKANVAAHRDALLAWLPPGAKVEVREATWSEAELREFITLVEQDAAWFSTNGIEFYAANIGGLDNLGGIDVRFRGPKATADVAAASIEAHFGNPPWMRAVWDGLLEWTGPRGTLEIRTVDAAGRLAPSIDIVVDSLDDRVSVNTDIGFMTDERGKLVHTNYPAVGYRVRAFEGFGDDRKVIGEGRVTVPANGRIALRLVVN